jgi:hypothetical protein
MIDGLHSRRLNSAQELRMACGIHNCVDERQQPKTKNQEPGAKEQHQH